MDERPDAISVPYSVLWVDMGCLFSGEIGRTPWLERNGLATVRHYSKINMMSSIVRYLLPRCVAPVAQPEVAARSVGLLSQLSTSGDSACVASEPKPPPQ